MRFWGPALALVASGAVGMGFLSEATAVLASGPTCVGPACSVTFSYTGAAQTFTVPAGVTALDVTALGSLGGGAPAGAQVAQLTVRGVPVTPGEVLTVEVGGAGAAPGLISGPVPGGYPDGGASGADGYSGGGSTRVEAGTTPLVVAGGDGGAGGLGANSQTGAVPGGLGGVAGRSAGSGQPGTAETDGPGISVTAPGGGEGGTASSAAGGAGGAVSACPSFGSSGAGAAGQAATTGSGGAGGSSGLTRAGGGGGGGGLLGGGGGGSGAYCTSDVGTVISSGGGGGAGSSFAVPSAASSQETSVTADPGGNGSVSISYTLGATTTAPPVPNTGLGGGMGFILLLLGLAVLASSRLPVARLSRAD